MAEKYKVIHYLNQFFGQIGGEDSAYQEPLYKKGPVGPGNLLNSQLENAEVIGTIICGDNFASENPEKLVSFFRQVIADEKPDILVAGPAFNSGRYGMACANLCKSAKNLFGIACLAGLFEGNPAVDLFRTDIDILRTKANAAGMKEAIHNISNVVSDFSNGDLVSDANRNLFFPKGKLKNIFDKDTASDRALHILKLLVKGGEAGTEIELPHIVNHEKAVLKKKLSEAEIALVTDGGLVPVGNPERLESRGASKFLVFDITGSEGLQKDKWSINHEGYDKQFVLEDPNRLVPLDALRYFEKTGKIRKVHQQVISTTGVATARAVCEKLGREIGLMLQEQNVDAVILTST